MATLLDSPHLRAIIELWADTGLPARLQPTVTDYILERDPLAYWPCNDPVVSHGVVRGLGRVAQTASVSGTVTPASNPGLFAERALTLSGGSYLFASIPASSISQRFTISCWINPASTPAAGAPQVIVGNVAANGPVLARTDTTAIAGYVGGQQVVVSTVGTANTLWVHVAWVYDHGVTRLYVAGSEVTILPAGVSSTVPVLDTTWRIGGAVSGLAGSVAFPGSIAHVAIYSRPLTAEEVIDESCTMYGVLPTGIDGGPLLISTEDFRVPYWRKPVSLLDFKGATQRRTVFGLGTYFLPVCYYSFSWSSGTTVYNDAHSAGSRQVTVSAASAIRPVAAGYREGGHSLATGTSAYGTVAHTSLFEHTGDSTLGFWVYIQSSSSTSGRLFTKRLGASTTYNFDVFLSSSTITAARVVSGQSCTVTTTYTLTPGWHHVCVVRYAGHMFVVVDGVVRGVANDPTGTTATGNTDSVGIGAYPDGTALTQNVFIDEVFYLARALSFEEIETMYRLGVSECNSWVRGRLIAAPEVEVAGARSLTLDSVVESVTFSIANADFEIPAARLASLRGRRVVLHLYDTRTNELTADVFTGVVNAVSTRGSTVDIVATTEHLAVFDTKVPRYTVSPATFSRLTNDAPMGATVPALLSGVGRRIPARYVRGQVTADDPPFFDYTFGIGNVGILAVWTGNIPAYDMTLFSRIYREYFIGNQGLSTIRFAQRIATGFGDGDTLPVTADVVAAYGPTLPGTLCDLKWLGSTASDTGIGDAITDGSYVTRTGVVAQSIAGSDLQYISGPHVLSSLGVGAIRIPASTNYDRFILLANTSQATSPAFTIEAWVWFAGGTTTERTVYGATRYVMTWACGPDVASGTLGHSDLLAGRMSQWSLGINISSGDTSNGFFTVTLGSGEVWTTNPYALNQWRHVMVSCRGVTQGGTAAVTIFVDGEFAGYGTVTNVSWPTRYDGPMMLGMDPHDGRSPEMRLGAFRFAFGESSIADARRAYHQGTGNPAIALGTFLERELDQTVNWGSVLYAARTLQAQAVAPLQCDALLIEETNTRAVLESFSHFCGLRPMRDAIGRLGARWHVDATWDYRFEVLFDAPVLYYPLDSFAGTGGGEADWAGSPVILPATDQVGANVGIVGGCWYFTAGYVESAGNPSDDALLLFSNHAFTFECWLYNVTTTNNPVLFSIFDLATSQAVATLTITSAGALTLTVQGQTAVTLVAAGGLSTTTSWRHLAVVVTHGWRAARAHVNGVAQPWAAIAPATAWPGSSSVRMVIRLGTSGAPITGALDEVALYLRTLTGTRIAQHYTAGLNHGKRKIVAAFDIADGAANMLDVPRRVYLSASESIARLLVEYGPLRDEKGAFTQYAGMFERVVHAAGGVDTELVLNFVSNSETADYLASWQAFWLRQAEEAIDITVGHEARDVLPGQCVVAQLPDAPTEQLYVVERVNRGSTAVAQLRCTPYQEFSYTPSVYRAYVARVFQPRLHLECNDKALENQDPPTTLVDSSIYNLTVNRQGPMWFGQPPGMPHGGASIFFQQGQTTSYLSIDSHNINASAGLLIVAMVCPMFSGTTPTLFYLQTTAGGYIWLYITTGGSVRLQALAATGGTLRTLETATGVITSNMWDHVAVYFRPDGTSWSRIWVDGVVRAAAQLPNESFSTSGALLNIGRNAGSPSGTYWGGSIDDLFVSTGTDIPVSQLDTHIVRLANMALGTAEPTPAPLPVALPQELQLDLGGSPQIRVGAGPNYATQPGNVGTGSFTFSRGRALRIDVELATNVSLRMSELILDTIPYYSSMGYSKLSGIAFSSESIGYMYVGSPAWTEFKDHYAHDVFRPKTSSSEVQYVRIRVWVRTTASSPPHGTISIGLIGPSKALVQRTFGFDFPTSYTEYTATWIVNPWTTKTWTVAEVNATQVYLGVANLAVGFELRVSAIRLEVGQYAMHPHGFGHVRVWRTTVNEPPPISSPPLIIAPSLIGLYDSDMTNANISTGDYYYWARVYDSLGRPSGLIGPTRVTITT